MGGVHTDRWLTFLSGWLLHPDKAQRYRFGRYWLQVSNINYPPTVICDKKIFIFAQI